MIGLEITPKSDPRLKEIMPRHYSQPRGFVGRSICYAISYNGVYYGHIIGGSATKYLPGRYEGLGLNKEHLNNIVNNIFYHIEPTDGKYPLRNFTVKVLSNFRHKIINDWELIYGDKVLGFESLIEYPRTGELYRRDGWVYVGDTKGYTCKRIAGESTDSWTGKRIWDTANLRPKRVFIRKV